MISRCIAQMVLCPAERAAVILIGAAMNSFVNQQNGELIERQEKPDGVFQRAT
jgi:hypothetical protein